jgi:DNA-binding LacI/PurR family transcriptional regulator
VGLLAAATRAGIAVPAELSVVGYDDDRLSRLSHIDLTTVGQDAPRMARFAVEAAVARLDRDGVDPPSGNRPVVIAPHLVVRGTTGPPAASPRRERGRGTGAPRA